MMDLDTNLRLAVYQHLDGGLVLADVVDASGTASAVYLIVLSRIHFDNLPSGGLINLRRKVSGKLKDQIAASLKRAKGSSEEAYESSAGAQNSSYPGH
jgi:hypothetical protein